MAFSAVKQQNNEKRKQNGVRLKWKSLTSRNREKQLAEKPKQRKTETSAGGRRSNRKGKTENEKIDFMEREWTESLCGKEFSGIFPGD